MIPRPAQSALLLLTAVSIASGQSSKAPFSVVEATIPQMQAAMRQGRVTSRELVTQSLVRIATYEDQLHAVLTVNPRALDEAAERDRERAAGHVRGPLHGIPIAVKDNMLTRDIVTTGGALAFAGYLPPYDATIVKKLGDAGAVIIAKTTLTELANWVAGAPTPMPANYNAVRGFAFNPYDPRIDPRDDADGRPVMTTGGSSSGAGTAMSFWAANVGSETSGSILSPSNQNMLAGIKPTVGRISRYGVIPISADQDTAGPMARTVTDAAILLGVLEGADPNDPATTKCPPVGDYTAHLKTDALKGARIGIPRAFFYERQMVPGTKNARGGLNPDQARVMTEAIDALKKAGATVIDPVEIPSITTGDPAKSFLRWDQCSGANNSKGQDSDCSVVLKYGMKRDFNKWLATLGPSAPVKTLKELREWNLQHAKAGAIRFGQSLLDISDEMDVEADRERYLADRAKDLLLTSTNGIDAALKSANLDALLFPGPTGAAIAAKPGYPTVIVPFGLVPNAGAPAFPEGFKAKAQPFGVSFTGLACSEARLIELGYAFEQATKGRVVPVIRP